MNLHDNSADGTDSVEIRNNDQVTKNKLTSVSLEGWRFRICFLSPSIRLNPRNPRFRLLALLALGNFFLRRLAAASWLQYRAIWR